MAMAATMVLTAERLAPMCVQPTLWLAPLTEAMDFFQINTDARAAMFIAQCAHESIRFSRLEENLFYSASRLLEVWPHRFNSAEAMLYANKPEAIANRVYAKRGGNGDERSGDGWRFRGRGLLQITFRNNYAACAEDCGLPELLAEPDHMAQPKGAVLGSSWFWWRNGCNEVADEGDFDGVSGIINRGDRKLPAMHMKERWQWLERAKQALL